MPESVVLIPGLQADGISWLNLLGRLARQYPVTVPRGHQFEDTIFGMGERIIGQLPPRFHLVGWSMGGYVAFEILRRWPERLLSLTLIATTAAPESAFSRPRRTEALSVARSEGMRSYQTRNMKRCLFDPDSADPSLIEAIVQSSETLGLSALERQTQAILSRPDSRPDLGRCPCPVLIAVGKNDEIIPPENSREMHRLLPSAAYLEFENCGHCPPLECPDEVFRSLNDWFLSVEGLLVA
ncbi:alpha/beta hydrolase [uncultured Roseibium sp.]|uniref:alpha/beta fold hydrolase n=1 Tax=uncultured Roseibium sp. TaxID=1936171 RepID=UPI002603C568|nr:alpha/beta hydrolase [uncultured Roseibium sp.]